MSEVKRFDVPSMRSLTQGEQAVMGYEVVLAYDYDALAAEAQALREERDSQQRVAINAMEELAALRARVVVLPDASTVYAALDARERLFTSPENIQVALEAQSRITGLTVSEGLLRRLVDFAAAHPSGKGLAAEVGALLSEQEGGKA